MSRQERRETEQNSRTATGDLGVFLASAGTKMSYRPSWRSIGTDRTMIPGGTGIGGVFAAKGGVFAAKAVGAQGKGGVSRHGLISIWWRTRRDNTVLIKGER